MYLTMNENLSDQPTIQNHYFRKEWVLRFLATPIFAIFVANVAPLVFKTDSLLTLLFNYAYFTLQANLLWSGNRWLLYKLRGRNEWIKNPVIKTISILSIHLFFSFALSFILLIIWNKYITATPLPINNLLLASSISSILSILVTFLYEIVLLTKERRIDQLKAEKMSNAKIQAELDTLKSQIDPHFIFNSLNTLSVLISDDRDKALLFNENLAKVYRYILANRANDLVTVKEEVDFINSYFFLLKIRFEESLNISMKIESLDLNRYYLPTIAIQTAIENAIKHNQFSENRPLHISIEINNDFAIVSNNKRSVKYKVPSSGVGLFNLDNRYKIILNKAIHIDETHSTFTLYLPIVKQ